MSENFTPTHITAEGTPVVIVSRDEFAVQTLSRTGRERVLAVGNGEYFELGTAEAEEILTELHGADRAASEQESEDARVWMAQRLMATEAARSALALAIKDVLDEDLRYNVRRRLERGILEAVEALAPAKW